MIAKSLSSPPTSFPIRSSSSSSTSPSKSPLSIPLPAFGTFSFGPTEWVYPAVLAALRAGYRHLDCAWMYGCDEPIGAAIRDSGIPRIEIWITSKLPPHLMAPERVEGCLRGIVERMGVGYVDLWLIHWPLSWRMEEEEEEEEVTPRRVLEGIMRAEAPVVDWEHTSATTSDGRGSVVPTWRAMQECVRKGLARAVGVSNFSCKEMREVLPHQGDVPLSVVQVEMHPWFPQRDVVKFAEANGILVEAYSVFGGNGITRELIFKDPGVQALAEENGLDMGQMVVSWLVSRGVVPILKSTTPSRIKTNLDVVELPQRVIDALDALEEPNGAGRTSDPSPFWKVRMFRED